MPTVDVHVVKAEQCWALAQQYHAGKREEFLCVNLIVYAVGHWIEAALALQHKHPSAPARGVPHADREVLMRKFLVGAKWIEPEAADTYAELVAMRHTFADDGVQDRAFIEQYVRIAEPLVERLKRLIDDRSHRIRS